MNNNQQDMEVTFNDVCVAVIRSWRMLLAVCLAAALLVGGLMGLQGLGAYRSVSREQVQQNNEAYRLDYEHQIAAQEEIIQRMEGNIASQRQYLDHSILMHMDPQNCWTAKASYYLDNQVEDQQADPITALLVGYQAELTSGHVINAAAESVGIEPRYLKELLRISADTKSAVSSRLLTVAVCHPDADTAQAILDAMKLQIEKAHTVIAGSIGAHELTEVTHSLIKENDIGNMLQRQDEEFASLYNMENAVAKARETIASIELIQEPVPSKSMIVASALKGLVIGALLGLVLGCVWSSCRYLLSDRICSGADLVRRTGGRRLGSIDKTDRRYRGLDRWALLHQGRPLLPRADSFRLTVAELAGYSAGTQRILVCGEAPREDLEQLTKALQEKLPAAHLVAGSGDLLLDIPTAEALSGCDSVVLLAHAGQSRYSVISRQTAKLESLDKKLLGCIVLEQ